MMGGRFRLGGGGVCSLWLNGEEVYLLRGAERERIRTCSRGEVQAAVDDLNKQVDRLVVATVDWILRDEDEKQAAVARVAAAGAALFMCLAPRQEDRDLLVDMIDGQVAVVVPGSNDTPIEWLYLGGDPLQADPRLFLGYDRVVCQTAPGRVLGPDEVKRTRNWDRFDVPPHGSPILVGYAEDCGLAAEDPGRERRVFDRASCQVLPLERLASGRVASSLEKLQTFMNSRRHVAHFRSHGVRRDGARPAVLRVCDGFLIEESDVTPSRVNCCGSTVVLNACEGMSLRYGVENSMAARFFAAGAGQVVGATSRLATEYATDFMEEFYSRAFAGNCIGDSLLGARQSLVDRTSNPLALSYGYIGTYAAKVVQEAA